MQDYVHLHVHTQYSLLDGQSKIPNIVNKAVGNGMRGMAITDHGNMMGVKELADYIAKIKGDAKKDLAKLEEELKEADEKRKKEIEDNIEYQHRILAFKPIFGCEMYVAHNKKEDKNKGKRRRLGLSPYCARQKLQRIQKSHKTRVARLG